MRIAGARTIARAAGRCDRPAAAARPFARWPGPRGTGLRRADVRLVAQRRATRGSAARDPTRHVIRERRVMTITLKRRVKRAAGLASVALSPFAAGSGGVCIL